MVLEAPRTAPAPPGAPGAPGAPGVSGVPGSPEAAAPSRAPRLAQGMELIGKYEGSGFKVAPYLARRADGQTIQLSKLLYVVAEACDGRRSYEDIAAEASRNFGRRLSARNAKTLVEEKLNPLGVVANNDGSQPVLSKPDSLLALNLRKGVIAPGAVRALTTVFYPFFLPPVVIGSVVALGALDWWLFTTHGVAQGVRDTVMQPMLFLLMMGLVVVSAFLHEVGHATGLRYGGGEPGVMGAGVYLAFPAFYTDVTDAYRLSKGGRLRTDLGGLYFNALFVLATFGAYFLTGFEPLLFLILVQHIEMAHQLLPFLRLDGYYVVADAVGVPDLFTRIGPILKSMIPGRKSDARVTALKPWVRFFVTAWVCVVVPFLVFNLVLLLVHLPRLLATGWESVHKNGGAARAAFTDGNVLGGLGGGLQLLVLLLPFVGILYTLVRVFLRVGRRSWAWSADSYRKRGVVLAGGAGLAALLAWAWLPGSNSYTPIREGERGTISDYVASSQTMLVDRDVEPAFVPSGDASTVQLRDTELDEPVAPDPVPYVEPSADTATSGTTEPTAGTSESPAPEPSASREPSPAESAEVTVSPSAEVSP
jgi:putative peptide zinc metalloprotease protein